VPAATAARVLGLAEEAVVDTAVWSAGVPFLIVRLTDRATVDAAVLDTAVWTAELAGGEGAHVYVAAADGTDAHGRPIWHVRMFAPAMGIAEDPATGAAACAFAGALAADLPDGDHRVVIRQGVAMGRPSVLELGIDVAGGVPRKVTLGGHAVPMGEGQLETSPTDAPAT
jgi:trans-2,3-dihydro-3-hydroxyanthranilate isomerase